jgi:hypothetical protein
LVVLLSFVINHAVLAATADASLQPFHLEYTPDGFSVHVVVQREGQEIVFKKEPDFGAHKIFRGALAVGPDAKNDYLGFAYDRTAGSLFLDLNRNLDLTDDPDAQYRPEHDYTFARRFLGLHINVVHDGVTLAYVIDLEFVENALVEATVRSGWQGNVVINGMPYRLGYVDNLDGQVGKDDELVLVPVTNDEPALERVPGTPDRPGDAKLKVIRPFPVPDILCVGGKNYEMKTAFKPERQVGAIDGTLMEQKEDLGMVNIEGQYIQRLMLHGPRRVVIESPGPAVLVPRGDYSVQRIELARGFFAEPKLLVANIGDQPCDLKIAGPLNSQVKVTPSGTTLRLDYELCGIGGETYEAPDSGLREAPQFAVYKGDRKIASGNFEYG